MNDSAKYKFKKFKVGGKSKQETREGYNLVDFIAKAKSSVDDVTIQADSETGYITLNGQPTMDWQQIVTLIDITDLIEENIDYTLWQEIPHDITSLGCYVQIQLNTSSGSEFIATINASNGIRTFKITDKSLYTSISIYIQWGNVLTGGFNNYKNRFMLLKGTYTDNTIPPYEPYGAMPSPDYPSEIRNVGDNVNILDISSNNHTTSYSNVGQIQFTETGYLKTVNTNQDGDWFYVPVKAGKEYTISYSTNALFTNIRLYKSDKTTIFHNLEIGTDNSIIRKTFIAEEDGIYFRTWIVAEQNAKSAKLYWAKIEQGTQATPYTPYGCGSVDIKVQNKNMLNIKKLNLNNTYEIKDENSFYITNRTPPGTYFFDSAELDLESGTYTISGDYTNSLNLDNVNCCLLSVKHKDGSSTRGETVTYSKNEDENIRLLVYWCYLNTQAVGKTYSVYFNNVQIEKKSTATKYVPYEEQTITFPLAKPLHKNDYLADDGIHHKRKTIVLDGTESWIQFGSNSIFRLRIINIKPTDNFSLTGPVNAISSHFKGITWREMYDTKTLGIAVHNTTKDIYISTEKTITTVEQFKNWLAEQYANGTPVVVEYELAEEEIEEYTAEQQEAYNKLKQLYSYEDVTHITCENDITCNFNVEHFKDYNILRQNDKQELQAQIDEIKASLVSEVSE